VKTMNYRLYKLEDGSALVHYEDDTIHHIPLTDDGELDFDKDYFPELLAEDELELESSEEELNAYA